jgi:hypothetical protein
LLHADIKPLNIIRTSTRWKLIDLDAACVIGKDVVGAKSSRLVHVSACVYRI